MILLIQKRLNNQRGAALIATLIMFVVLMVFAYSALAMSQHQTLTTGKYEERIDAIHYAEAGVNEYLWSLNKNAASPPALDTDHAYDDGFYRLDVTNQGDGFVRLKSTGWNNRDDSSKRSIEVLLSKRTFTQYVYFSDNDPDNIRWVSTDTNYGPYHTNGNITIDGNPTFWGRVTYNGQIHFYNGTYRGGTGTPDYNPHGTTVNGSSPVLHDGIRWTEKLEFPPSNSELMIRGQESDGYYYDGLTRIMLHNNGKITVVNNGTTQSQIDLPANGVIYVNGTSNTGSNKFNAARGNVFVSGTLNGQLTIAAANNIYITGYNPTVTDFDVADNNPTGGLVYHNTTFSEVRNASNVLTGYTANTENGSDMLGLVANNDIWVLSRGWFDGSNNVNVAPENITIHGAVFALNGSFGYEIAGSYNGSWYWPSGHRRETISLRGALIQNVRGAIGQDGGSERRGYRSKDYAHDPRLLYTTPPYFIEPVNSGWEIVEWKESSQHLQ